MTIRHRLGLSFVSILVLFGLNLAVYFSFNRQRSGTVETLRKAISRQVLFLSARQEVEKLSRQVQLLSQTGGGATPALVQQFAAGLDPPKKDFAGLEELATPETLPTIKKLSRDYDELSQIWLRFYRAKPRETQPIADLAMKGEPLSEQLNQQLTQLLHDEEQRVELARRNYYRVVGLADQISVILFGISMFVAATVAYRLSRYLTTGLGELEAGAARIGAGNLTQKVEFHADDELGHVARGFNEMRENLLAARTQLESANEELERRHAELQARDQELQRANSQLRLSEQQAQAANQAKSTFLANMSHELRTPLNAIIGFSEVLVDGTFGELNPRQTRYTNNILTSGKHLLSLINDILDLAKVESGKMQLELSEINIPEALRVVETVVKPLAQKKGQTLAVEALGELPKVSADEGKLKQVMYNLVSNAIKYTPDGGKIRVSAELTRDPQVTPDEDSLVVSVQDTGVGIKPEDFERVFAEFEQLDDSYARQQQGTGLGLALTRRLIEMHGGRIWVESEGPGLGSTFRFVLPLRARYSE